MFDIYQKPWDYRYECIKKIQIHIEGNLRKETFKQNQN